MPIYKQEESKRKNPYNQPIYNATKQTGKYQRHNQPDVLSLSFGNMKAVTGERVEEHEIHHFHDSTTLHANTSIHLSQTQTTQHFRQDALLEECKP
jgi:hypothetical protein